MLNFHLLANYIKYLTIAIKVTNGVFAPLIDDKTKKRNKKKEKTYETLRIETEVKRQLALACPKAYTYSEFLCQLLSRQKKAEK